MNFISCNNVSFSYGNNIVVSGINFQVHAGDYLCIVGENGSGKSTLLKGLLNLKKASSGEILFQNLRHHEIGYLPQHNPVQQDFPASVYEVVLSGRLNQGRILPFYSKEDKQVATKYLSQMGMLSLKERCFQELSGGQKQRILLARALCATTKLLILDEPVAGLDPEATVELYREIRTINEVLGITIVMVSHDMGAILKDAKSVLHLSGQQLFFGSKEDYQNSEVGEHYLCHYDAHR